MSVLKKKEESAKNMGQRDGFSKSDILKVKKMYCP